VYYLLNKPVDVISTAIDTHDRETVVDLVPAEPRVYPVGRLDGDSEGLLLITNDGELTNRITHPKYGLEKEYLVQVDISSADVSDVAIHRLRNGIELEDGMQEGVLRLVIHEGRNRQIRRMCEAVGYPVIRLVRTRIGPIMDKKLGPGQWRNLTQAEVKLLIEAVTE
jgi:23S rRNA pseudouridine2605 synthase